MAELRNPMFDILKGLGIISVIFSHVYRGGTDPLAVFIRELAMWCVPMFFMVQGYFMYSPTYRRWLWSSWNKIKKVYIPYLYWAVAYGLFFYFTIGKTFGIMDLIYGKTALHLYYMFYYIVFAIFCPAVFPSQSSPPLHTLFYDTQQHLLGIYAGNKQNLRHSLDKLVRPFTS